MTIQNREKLYDLIKDCEIRRLTTEESLEYIKQNGEEVSERTYRRFKSDWRKKTKERILSVLKENDSETLQRLDTMKKIEKELWIMYHSTNDLSLKKKILDSIRDLQSKLVDTHKDARWRARRIENEIEEKKSPDEEELNPLIRKKIS